MEGPHTLPAGSGQKKSRDHDASAAAPWLALRKERQHAVLRAHSHLRVARL